MISQLLKKIKSYFTKSTPTFVNDIDQKFEIVDTYESLTVAIRISEGKYKGVVFSVIRITPREEESKETLKISYTYEIIEAPVPAEQLEHNKDFEAVVSSILSQMLESNHYEASNSNHPWLSDLE